MKTETEAIPIQRYIAIDIHKHYVMVGGMNQEKEYVLRTRKVRMSRLSEWVQKNIKPTDAVVIESTSNAWEDRGRQSLEGGTNCRCQGQNRQA